MGVKRFRVKTTRPEDLFSSPEDYFTPEIVESYSSTNAIRKEQRRIAGNIEELLEMTPPARVLDLGCGPGFSMEYFKELGYDVVGIDIVEEMVKKAREKGLEVLLGDARRLGDYFPGNYFDYVVSISAVQWITRSRRDVDLFARGMNHILRGKGKFGIQFYPQSSEELEMFERVLKRYFGEVQVFMEKPDSLRKRRFYVVGVKI